MKSKKHALSPRRERFTILSAIKHRCEKNDIPSIDETAGQVLYLLTTLHKPNAIAEVGTGGGYSTAWLAKAQSTYKQPNIVTFETNTAVFSIASKNLKSFSYGINLQNTDACTWLHKNKQQFDMFFIDGKKTDYPKYLEASLPHCNPGAVIIFDDVLFWLKQSQRDKNPEVQTILKMFSEQKLKKFMVRFNKKLLARNDMECIVLPINNGLAVCKLL